MPSVHFLNTAYIYQKLYDLLIGSYLTSSDYIIDFFSRLLFFLRPFSTVLSLLCFTGIVYCMIRTRAIVHEAEEKIHAVGHAAAPHAAFASSGKLPEKVVNERWEKITGHINSANPSDWRLAILECDIILDEMLTKMSYRGETLSDKLKAVEKSDFLTIDKAWEAHRVRNAIAHEGSNFQIMDREARRVVGLYEEVFKEFHYI